MSNTFYFHIITVIENGSDKVEWQMMLCTTGLDSDVREGSGKVCMCGGSLLLASIVIHSSLYKILTWECHHLKKNPWLLALSQGFLGRGTCLIYHDRSYVNTANGPNPSVPHTPLLGKSNVECTSLDGQLILLLASSLMAVPLLHASQL